MKKQKILWATLIVLSFVLLFDYVSVYKYHNHSREFNEKVKKNDLDLIREEHYIILKSNMKDETVIFVGTPNSYNNLIKPNSGVQIEKIGWFEYFFGPIRKSIVDKMTTGF
ncbi:hypothetical protein [Bacillus cereus group sp. TH152-1LC]|uniref:hypothetical protein n=1 Tax=Bacillus cereus group sp. TH152-1LC TaxID=3018060 RepID=UPI0022DF4A33|nr:hypothetical protein [Bacillus cereus group sp. TH152-1LC]MDA1675612.1 hypothetical protein [Bacillus cereus group sp. TH152-1LC]